MPERVQQILDRVVEWWKSFNRRQKTMIISLAAIVVAALGILVFVVSRPNMVTLINCESATQASEVTTLLSENNIGYETSSDGLVIKVDEKNEAQANILLGSNSIPSAGYSISDVVDGSFSTTEADKQKKYQVFLETKIANALATLKNVKSAEVTLSLPTDDGTLISKKEDAYANVILSLSGEMDEETAAGLAQYVATGLGNDDTKNIHIMDDKGNVLFSGPENSSASGSANSNQNAKAKAEAKVQSQVKDVLMGTELYDNVSVGANLIMDFDKVVVDDYDYHVDDGRTEGYKDSETIYETESTSGAGGVPGTDSNDGTTYVLDNGNSNSSTTSDRTIDYLPDETITHTEKATGGVDYENSSISVVATNYVIYNEEKMSKSGELDGTTFDDFVKENSEKVKQEVDDDTVALISSATGIPQAKINVVAYDVPLFQYKDSGTKDFTFYIEIILVVLILAMLAYVVLRSLRRDEDEYVEEELSVDDLLEQSQEELDDIAYSEKSEARILIEKFVDERPEAVANLLRNWLNDDWG